MIINNRVFFGMLQKPELIKRNLHEAALLAQVRRYYCTPMTLARKCTTNCQNCKLTLQKAIYSMPVGEQKPFGLLVYRLRNLMSEKVEVEHVAQVRTVDNFGTKDDTNVFDALLAEVS
jgi:hypothetical protein